MDNNTSGFEKIKQIWAQESEGIGDTVAKITKTIGIEPCEECEERRKKWNKKIAYKKKQSGG